MVSLLYPSSPHSFTFLLHLLTEIVPPLLFFIFLHSSPPLPFFLPLHPPPFSLLYPWWSYVMYGWWSSVSLNEFCSRLNVQSVITPRARSYEVKVVENWLSVGMMSCEEEIVLPFLAFSLPLLFAFFHFLAFPPSLLHLCPPPSPSATLYVVQIMIASLPVRVSVA